jgi:outer membrane immunogenic protein
MIARNWPLGARQGMKGPPMRWVICALAVLGLVPRAFAQDFDVLRGTQPVGPALYNNWTGVYFGGQWGFNDGSAAFNGSTAGPIAYVLRETKLEENASPSNLPVLGTADHTAQVYGGFVGYNSQWQDLMLGVEANFNHTSLVLNAPSSPIVRSNLSDGAGNTYTIGVSAAGTMSDINYASLRGRAGLILGNFLPYGFLGAVVGVANLNITAEVQGTCDAGSTASCEPFAFIANGGRNSDLLYGISAGAGMDYALTRNIFLRGEYEYIHFAPISGTLIAISSVRLGAGFKF